MGGFHEDAVVLGWKGLAAEINLAGGTDAFRLAACSVILTTGHASASTNIFIFFPLRGLPRGSRLQIH